MKPLTKVERAADRAARFTDDAARETAKRDAAIRAAVKSGESMRAVAAAAGLTAARVHGIVHA